MLLFSMKVWLAALAVVFARYSWLRWRYFHLREVHTTLTDHFMQCHTGTGLARQLIPLLESFVDFLAQLQNCVDLFLLLAAISSTKRSGGNVLFNRRHIRKCSSARWQRQLIGITLPNLMSVDRYVSTTTFLVDKLDSNTANMRHGLCYRWTTIAKLGAFAWGALRQNLLVCRSSSK